MKTKKTASKKTTRKKTAAKKPAIRKTAVKKKAAKPAAEKKAEKKTGAKTKKTAPRGGRLLAGEPAPWRIENEKGKAAGLVICDHASFRVPAALKDMGLKKSVLKKHIGWDIGAEEAALHISRKLDMPAVIAQYSRLVVDLNRAPDYRECMPDVSDHIAIPANAALTEKDRKTRLDAVYWPYHNAVARMIDGQAAAKKIPFLLFVHSLTPRMDGVARPWHICILWKKEEKLAKRMVQSIRAVRPDLLVGENEPYSLYGERFVGSSVWRHAEERGLPYVLVEFRQDLVDTKQKARDWADIFIAALRPLLADPATYAGRKGFSG